MKLSKWIIGLALLSMVFLSCKKDEESTETKSKDIEKTPGAVAAYNNSSAGVYKGILVGSSGYFKLSIRNGTDTVSCKLVFDGDTAYLTTTSFANWQPGQPISNAIFSGTLKGQTITLTLNCNSDGTNANVNVNFPGHTINVSVVKETSTTLVKCYEGTYTDGNETGVFNVAVYGTKAYGFRKDPYSMGYFTGTIDGSVLTVDEGENVKRFNIDDNSINGTFPGDNNVTVTVTGHRSM